MSARAWWWEWAGGQASIAVFRYSAGDSLAALGATFTRASSGTDTDANGVIQTATTNVARDGHYISGVRTLLLEGQRTNSFLNSGTPASHTSPSLGTGTYTLWLVGTGSIAIAGGTGTITGAGTATAAAPVTFVVTVAGTVTFTVVGAPTRADSENGPFATSYILTAGTAVTRSADTIFFPWSAVPQAMSIYGKLVVLGTQPASGAFGLFQIGSSSNSGVRLQAYFDTGGSAVTAAYSDGSTNASAVGSQSFAIGDTLEFLVAINTDGSISVTTAKNGGSAVAAVTSAQKPTFPAAFAGTSLYPNSLGSGAQGFSAFQSVKGALGVRTLDQMRAA